MNKPWESAKKLGKTLANMNNIFAYILAGIVLLLAAKFIDQYFREKSIPKDSSAQAVVAADSAMQKTKAPVELIYSNTQQADRSNQQQVEKRKLNEKPGAVSKERFHNSDFSVMIFDNGKSTLGYFQDISDWLNTNASISKPIVKSANIEWSNFDQVLGGKTHLLKNIEVIKSSRYSCLLRVTSKYNASTLNQNLVRADIKYELLVIENETGIIKSSFEKTCTASDIDQDLSREKCDNEFMEHVKKRFVQL
jgi:hypothetical protein